MQFAEIRPDECLKTLAAAIRNTDRQFFDRLTDREKAFADDARAAVWNVLDEPDSYLSTEYAGLAASLCDRIIRICLAAENHS